MICLNSGGHLVRSQVEDEKKNETNEKAACPQRRPDPDSLFLPLLLFFFFLSLSLTLSCQSMPGAQFRGLASIGSSHRSRKDVQARPTSKSSRQPREPCCCTRRKESLHLRRRSQLVDAKSTPSSCDHPMRGPASAKQLRIPDPETGVAPGWTRCRNMRSRCRCSMCPAIHINSRSWLRSSSTHEPSDPPLRVVKSSRARQAPLSNTIFSSTTVTKNKRPFGAAPSLAQPGGAGRAL